MWSSVHRHRPMLTHKHTHTLTLPTNKLPVILTRTDSYTSLTSHTFTHTDSYTSLTLLYSPSCRHKISHSSCHTHTHVVTHGKHPSGAHPPSRTHTHKLTLSLHTHSLTNTFIYTLFIYSPTATLPPSPPSPAQKMAPARSPRSRCRPLRAGSANGAFSAQN